MILRRAGGLWALLLVVVVSASVAAWFAVGDLAVEPPRPVETLSGAPPTAREIAIAAAAGLVLAAALAALAFATWRGWMRARWWWVTALLVVAASFGSVAVKGLEDPQSTGIAPAAWAMLMGTIPVPALMLAGALVGGFHLRGFPLAGPDAQTSAAERRRGATAAGAVAGLTAVTSSVRR